VPHPGHPYAEGSDGKPDYGKAMDNLAVISPRGTFPGLIERLGL
jgi:hypothetical protein